MPTQKINSKKRQVEDVIFENRVNKVIDHLLQINASKDNELSDEFNAIRAKIQTIKKTQTQAFKFQYSQSCYELAELCVPHYTNFLPDLVLESIEQLAFERLGPTTHVTHVNVFSLLEKNCQLILSAFCDKDSFENQLFGYIHMICEKTPIDLKNSNPISYLSKAVNEAESAKSKYELEHLFACIKFLKKYGLKSPNASWCKFLDQPDVQKSLINLYDKLRELIETYPDDKDKTASTASELATYGGPFAKREASSAELASIKTHLGRLKISD